MVTFAKENNITYINFLNVVDEIGIDYSTDTFDGGLHLNLSGAEKFSLYLGKILSETYGVADQRENAEIKKIWDEKVVFYYAMKADQEREMEEYGYLKSYGAQAQQLEVE